MMSIRGLAAAMFVAGAMLSPAGQALAASPAQNASVTITDSGFSPASLALLPGGSVTFINNGSAVHTATTTGTVPAQFDTGGLGPDQIATVTLTTPGVYTYSSAPDCLNGNLPATFACGTYAITVTSQPTASAAAVSAPAAVAGAVQDQANVTISDSGFSTHQLLLTTNGTITFTNDGTTVHTASSGSAPVPFDTGGLAPGQSKSIQLTQNGSYSFTSSTDCMRGNNNPAFDCSTPNTVTVAPAPAGAMSATAPAMGQKLVYMKDDTGFQPTSVTVAPGTTITWLNLGHNAHTVTSDPADLIAFDSGGVGEGSAFSVTFNAPGTYTYHSAADPLFSGTTQTGWKFTGQVIVQAPAS